jgi:hypothetical protein
MLIHLPPGLGIGDRVGHILPLLGESADVVARRRCAQPLHFGALTFAVGTEIFWGGDRLEEAIAFATGR